MSITINVITTANRSRCFTQHDDARVQEIFRSLGNCGQLFSSRVLILGSDHETEVFSPSSITRIEIETRQDISGFLPKTLTMSEMVLSALPADALDQVPTSHVDETHVAGRIDFFFEGGDTLPVWLEGVRPAHQNDRMTNLTKLFEKPVILYNLPQGGIGLMNPGAMTRALIKSGMLELPAGAWRVD